MCGIANLLDSRGATDCASPGALARHLAKAKTHRRPDNNLAKVYRAVIAVSWEARAPLLARFCPAKHIYRDAASVRGLWEEHLSGRRSAQDETWSVLTSHARLADAR